MPSPDDDNKQKRQGGKKQITYQHSINLNFFPEQTGDVTFEACTSAILWQVGYVS